MSQKSLASAGEASFCAEASHKHAARVNLIKSKIKNTSKEDQAIRCSQHEDSLTSEYKKAVKKGFLTIVSKGFIKKEKQAYFLLIPASPSNRAQLAQFPSESAARCHEFEPEHVILGGLDVERVAAVDHPKNAFVIRYKDMSVVLAAADEFERKCWITEAQRVLLSDCQDSFQDVQVPSSFKAFLDKETQKRIGDDQPIEIFVEHGAISVISATDVRIARWELSQIRSFSIEEDKFGIVTGRNAEHGQGTYTFVTKQGIEIRRTIKAANSSGKCRPLSDIQHSGSLEVDFKDEPGRAEFGIYDKLPALSGATKDVTLKSPADAPGHSKFPSTVPRKAKKMNTYENCDKKYDDECSEVESDPMTVPRSNPTAFPITDNPNIKTMTDMKSSSNPEDLYTKPNKFKKS